MNTTRVKVNTNDLSSLPRGRVDRKRLDATTDKDIQRQRKADEASGETESRLESPILEAVYETAHGFHRLGLIDNCPDERI